MADPPLAADLQGCIDGRRDYDRAVASAEPLPARHVMI